ncbi:helix-turn-helix transcriptional regulator [Eggerthellaceae bacterium 3-80]|nr:LuxR family transcriptional regulator [bacterium D16-34]
MHHSDKLIPLRKIGWAFLLAWVFCVFYTGAAGNLSTNSGQPSIALDFVFALTPLLASILTLIAVVLLEPTLGAPTSHPKLVFAAPILTAISTPLIFLSLPNPTLNLVAFCIGAILTGAGSAILWVMWGEYYAVIPREESEFLAPLSSVSAALLVLLVSATNGWVAIAMASLFPLLSGLCFYLSWTSAQACEEQKLVLAARENEKATQKGFFAGLNRAGFGIFGMFIIVSSAGIFDNRTETPLILQGTLLFSAAMMAIVASLAISGPRRISLSFLYRWMCPVLVVGFAAVILFGADGYPLLNAASLGGRFTFCLIAQIYFASYAASGKATPAQASGLGWIFVHAGDLVGCIIALAIVPYIQTAPNGELILSTLSIVVLVCITMLFMGDTTSFLHRTPTDTHLKPANRSASPNVSETMQLAQDEASRSQEVQVLPLPSESYKQADTDTPDATSASLDEIVLQLSREHGLTPRETEIFALLSRGRSIPYIRDELIISRETAATHAKHIYAKLGVHSRQELINLVENSL